MSFHGATTELAFAAVACARGWQPAFPVEHALGYDLVVRLTHSVVTGLPTRPTWHEVQVKTARRDSRGRLRVDMRRSSCRRSYAGEIDLLGVIAWGEGTWLIPGFVVWNKQTLSLGPRYQMWRIAGAEESARACAQADDESCAPVASCAPESPAPPGARAQAPAQGSHEPE